VNTRGIRTISFAGAVMALALVAAACSSAQPTPIYVVQTPAATATTQPTDTPTPTPAAATPTAAPTVSAAPTATPVASATAAASASPTSPAAFCTGAAANQPTFLKTANMLKGAVYCPTLGKGWSLANWTFDATKSPGWMKATYKSGSATIQLDEGAFCLTPTVCSPLGGSIGTANYGNITGGAIFQTAATDFSIYVSPGTKNAYDILGHNVSQANLVAAAAALKVIPKS
jgi:hypothetical protein